RWVDGWPEIGTDYDGNGVGEPMAIVPMPFGKSTQAFTPQTSDEFDGERLGVQWQTNHNPVWEQLSLSDHPGYLSIRPLQASRLRDARNQLTQKIMGYKSEATITIDWSDMKPGDRSGLLCIGKKSVGAGVSMEVRDGKTTPELYMEADSVVVFREPLPKLQSDCDVEIRLEIDTSGNCYKYTYSLDGGQTFRPLGEPFEMRNGFWKGVRVGLYAYTLSEEPGTTHFDWFRYHHDGND
ncbi:MAG: beta-xylosidase, partial [Muribaculaceae bacterium]|nr:beta-xylosidase [Muribaculaceae bacterium]